MKSLARLLPIAAIAAGLATAALPLFAQSEAAAPASAVSAAPAISVTPVVTSLLRDRVYASGMIAPVEQISVAPLVEGQQIETLLADVGDTVSAGQVIATLADDALVLQRQQLEASKITTQASIAQAEASLSDSRAMADEAVRVSDRTQSLRREGTVSQAAADQAASAATSALARVSAAEQGLAAARGQSLLVEAQLSDIALRIERTQIKAPVAGVITARNAQIGAIASAAGQPMFVLIRDGLLELRADVAEQDVLKLATGQPVTLRAVGLDRQLTGVVRLVDPTVEATTRLGRVRIALDTPEAVRSGLFAEAEILVHETQGLSAPVSAVASDTAGHQSVLRVDDSGVVTKIDVETGIRDGGMIEILSGLAEGDLLVARAGAFVRPGDKINPVQAAPTAPASN
jgi:HlyD family secretion protein